MVRMGRVREKNVMNLGFLSLLFSAILLFGAYTPALSSIYAFGFLFWVTFSFLFLSLRRTDRFTGLLFALWLTFFLASVLRGYVKGVEIQYLLSFLAICLFWCGSQALTYPKQVKLVWMLLLIMGLLYSIFALTQHMFTPDQIYSMPKKYHLGRLTGSFISSNTAATLLGSFVLISLSFSLRTYLYNSNLYNSNGRENSRTHLSVLGLTSFIFALTALLLTASRAGIAVSLFTSLIFLSWFFTRLHHHEKNRTMSDRHIYLSRGHLAYAIIIMGLIVLLWWFFGGVAQSRYSDLLNDTSQRADLAVAAWKTIELKPLFGHGLGHYNEVKLLGADEKTFENVFLHESVHNFYLQTLLQTGIFGLTAIIIAYLFIVMKIIAAVRRGVVHSTFMMTILCVSLIFCLHGLVDYALEVPALMLLHLWLLGVAYGLSNRALGQ